MRIVLLITFSFILSSSISANSVCILPYYPAFSQGSTFNDFERFNVHRKQSGVALSWTFSGDGGAAVFVIEKSYNGTSFLPIDQVVGSERGTSSYYDANVYAGFIYYRIKAILPGDINVYSHTDMVRIVSRK